MYLELKNDQILINTTETQLKSREVSQLNYWGFTKVNKSLYSINKESTDILFKLLKYFDKKEISYLLSDDIEKMLETIKVSIQDSSKLFEKGKKYKNGHFNQEDFDEHLKIVSDNLPRKLRDHQKKASYHLWLLKNAANFSVPGAGKTTVVLSVYERLRIENKVNKLFIIGPPACFGPWKEEFAEALGRKPKSKVLAGGNKNDRKLQYYSFYDETELYLTTFQTLRNDFEDLQNFLANNQIHAYLVVDEAHYIKQIDGSWANAALSVAKYANFRCILTGTPAPKSYTDLFNLFDFLWPQKSPITSIEKATIKVLEEERNSEEASRILEKSIGPLFYRVRKSELGLKEQLFHPAEEIVMNNSERIIYDAIVEKIRDYAVDDYLKNIDLVSKLRRGRMIRLRQCVSYAQLLSTAVEDYDEDIVDNNIDLNRLIIKYSEIEKPAKLLRLMEMLADFQRDMKKVVIWSNFLGTISLIEKAIKDAGYNSKKIIGATPVENTSVQEEETREKIRLEFIDPHSGMDILIANPAACAESISLHKSCNHAIYYDLSYNCAQYLQSLDRIHRVGGSEEKPAHYHFLHYANTIDADIMENLNNKAQKMYDIIEGDYNIYSLDMFDDSDEIDAYKRLFLDKND